MAEHETAGGARRADGHGPERASESVGEALARARRHARAAAAESVAALHALLDAASLATQGSTAADGALAPVAELMRHVEAWLGADARREGALYQALLDALDGEILRWERRSRSDPEARTVLRAFLAVRELLFELERRTPRSGAAGPTAAPASESDGEPGGEPTAEPDAPTAPRMRRVAVEG